MYRCLHMQNSSNTVCCKWILLKKDHQTIKKVHLVYFSHIVIFGIKQHLKFNNILGGIFYFLEDNLCRNTLIISKLKSISYTTNISKCSFIFEV